MMMCQKCAFVRMSILYFCWLVSFGCLQAAPQPPYTLRITPSDQLLNDVPLFPMFEGEEQEFWDQRPSLGEVLSSAPASSLIIHADSRALMGRWALDFMVLAGNQVKECSIYIDNEFIGTFKLTTDDSQAISFRDPEVFRQPDRPVLFKLNAAGELIHLKDILKRFSGRTIVFDFFYE